MSQRDHHAPPQADVRLSERDLDSLVRVSDLYMSARPFRALVRSTAPREIRARFRFVADESMWLKRLAKEIRASMRVNKETEREVPLTIPAFIGYWGRLLASLNTPRHRRRLSKSEVEIRESLTTRFQDAGASLMSRHRREIEAQIATRRPIEQGWMREALGLPRLEATPPPER